MTQILSAVQNADFAVLDSLQASIRNPFLDTIMPYITHLGAGGILWIILAFALIFLKKYRRSGFTVLTALILCLIFCNGLLKNLVARIRPFDINTMIELLVEPPADFSFPSGHATASFAAAAALLLCRNKLFGIPALIIAVLIAFSRLYLYVHFPTDVFCGMMLGIILAFAAHMIMNVIYKKIEYRKT